MNTAIARFADRDVQAGLSGLRLIPDNGQAFAARVLAARGAVHSLDLMYYLWHDDRTGRLMLDEVTKAADRGVRVRLLLDDINTRTSENAYLALDSHENIELRLFNPTSARNGSGLRWLELAARLFALTRRMHNKAWIVDAKVAIVGGRNIGDAYFDAADTNFRDLDMLLIGPAVDQTAAIFEDFWAAAATSPVRALNPGASPVPRPEIPATSDLADELLEEVGRHNSIGEFIAADSIHWVKNVRVISDPPEKASGERRRNWLMRELLPLIRSARGSLAIVSPYFIPGRNGTRILADLVKQGVDVVILTNSLAATDVAAAHGAYANYRKALLRAGVRLFELQPFHGRRNISVFGSKGASLHTKAFVVDDRAGFVGSFNFDPRSVSLNAEMGVLFEDEALAAELKRIIRRERSPRTSYRLSLLGWQLRWEAQAGGRTKRFVREPEAGFVRRLLAGIVRYLPIESQL
jgi:putative cardiolipin synthase